MVLRGMSREWCHHRICRDAFGPVGVCSARQAVFWGIDDEERSFLLAETTCIFDVRAIICRARPHADVPGLLLIDATVEELDEMYTLVEELTDMMTGRRQRDLLDGLRASLCNSMDGF